MPTYTNISEVKRILNSSTGNKVRFSSNCVKEIVSEDSKRNINDDLMINVSGIIVDDSFSGSESYRVKFLDATNYNVYKIGSEGDYREFLIGSSDIATSYLTSDGYVTISAGCFSGVIQAGDVIKLSFKAHVSDEDAERFIEDAEATVDGFLNKYYLSISSSLEETMYGPGQVPKLVRVATTYLAAYHIYTDVFFDIIRDDNDTYVFIDRWRDRAERNLRRFAEHQTRGIPYAISQANAFEDVFEDGFLSYDFSAQIDEKSGNNVEPVKQTKLITIEQGVEWQMIVRFGTETNPIPLSTFSDVYFQIRDNAGGDVLFQGVLTAGIEYETDINGRGIILSLTNAETAALPKTSNAYFALRTEIAGKLQEPYIESNVFIIENKSVKV